MALGHIIIRSPYTPYSIYLRGTIGVQDLGCIGQNCGDGHLGNVCFALDPLEIMCNGGI